MERVGLGFHPKFAIVATLDCTNPRGRQRQTTRASRRHVDEYSTLASRRASALPDLQIMRHSIYQARFEIATYDIGMSTANGTQHAAPHRTASGGAVLVTGASRGLGRGIALELATAGHSIAINYRQNREAAEKTAAACAEAASQRPNAAGPMPRFVPVRGDIAVRAERERLIEETIEHFGAIESLINNAGIAPDVRADITEASEESFERIVRTNLQGPYFLTQAVVRRWLVEKERDADATDVTVSPRHHIVFVTSISAATASINRGDYCISKAGLAMVSQLWATRLAGDGINVYEVRPGVMETDMTAGVKEKYDALIAEGLVPQKRWGRPEDIGRIVRSILAGDLAFSSGAVIYSDGGFNISRL